MTATTTTIAHLKITLDDVKPEVLRRIEVPFNIRLDRLHLAVQAAMGWTNTHLYEIRAGDVGWGVPDPDWGDSPLDARKAHLNKVLEDVGTKTVKYIYDFGDGWDHTITIERLTDPVPGLTYPFLIEAKGRCPPEDVGGPPGYSEFLEAIRDPEHERHDECKTWIGKVFDPTVVDANTIAEQLADLAKRWSRKPATKRPRSLMRPSTSASQACGSTSLSLAVMISVAMTAARSAPRSEPANSQDFRPSAKPRSARSAALFVRQIRPSSMNRTNRCQRLSM